MLSETTGMRIRQIEIKIKDNKKLLQILSEILNIEFFFYNYI